jgi:ketosteroid isomerase-like protein
MSSANLDLVRSICTAWERGDFGSAEWASADIEFVMTNGPEDSRLEHGLAGMGQTWRRFLSAWDDARVEVDDYRELDGDRVLVFLHYDGGRGKASGLDLGKLRTTGATLFHVRAGRVSRLVVYADRGWALAELGLAPDGGA